MRISEVTINEELIPLTNMVVIVGSNGTGKTRLLEELNWNFTNRGTNTGLWEIEFKEELSLDDITQWIDLAISHNNGAEKRWYSPFTKFDGQLDGVDMEDSQYQRYATGEDSLAALVNSPFLKEFINYLPITFRLSLPTQAQMGSQNQRVNEILNLLFRTPSLVTDINVQLKKFFKKKLVLSPHNIPNLELKVVDIDAEEAPTFNIQDPTPSYQAYLTWVDSNHVGYPTAEGHGIQAFLHILLSHCVPQYHVLLIDEPEVHLYPSVKRKFGNTLGEISASENKQFFCVTHDNDFLQGIIDSKCPATIIKINKNGRTRKIFHKTLDEESKYLASQNQTPFLQIPFLDAVIIVEGATDRFCYDFVFGNNGFLSDVEYKFISAGGSDSVVNPERIAYDMNVPCAIILDIENLKEKESAKSLLKLFALKEQVEIQQEILEIGKLIKGIPDLVVKGLDAVTDPVLKARIRSLITELKGFGIFIIHKGTLESWSEVPTKKTNQFPEKFVEEYLKDKKAFSELTLFLGEITEYIQSEITN